MSKFKVGFEGVGSGFRLTVTAVSTGRVWHSLGTPEGCPGNAGESAMVTQEWLDMGNKLGYPAMWEEKNLSLNWA
jgi:hypothetical protein